METGSFKSAVGWSFALSGGRQAFGFVITVILAAILGPTAYGTVAMAYVFVSFTQLFLVQGLMPALIQRRDLTSSQLSSVFWLALGASAGLAGLSVAASGWWSSVNHLPDLQPVIVALSALLPISGLMVVQESWLRRHLQFRQLAVRENLSVVVGGLAGIGAALLGAGVWALVIQQLGTQIVAVAVLWRVSDWRPDFHCSFAEVRELVPFTAASSVSAIGTFVNNQGDALIIGLFFGPEVVGLYRFAARIVATAVQVLARSFQAVSLPELARHQRDQNAIRRRLKDLLSLASLATVPLLAVMAAVAPWFIPLLGSEWGSATTALQILCAVGIMRVFATFSGPLLQAINRPSLLAVLVWFGAGLSAAAFVIAGVVLEGSSVASQVNGMAVAGLAVFSILMAVNSWILRRFGGLGLRDQFATMLVPSFAGAVAFGVGTFVWTSGATDDLGPLLSVFFGSALSAGAAAVVLVLCDHRVKVSLVSAVLALERGVRRLRSGAAR